MEVMGVPEMPDQLQAARWWLVKQRPYLATALWALVPVATEACTAPVIRREWFLPPEELARLPQKPGMAEEPVIWVPTMSVDRYWRLYFHPKVVDIYTVEELARTLYHEVSHLLRDHASRAEEMRAQPLVANVAQDIAINQDLREDDDFAPPYGLYPEYFQLPPGLTWEAYYEILEKRLPKKGSKEGGFPPPLPGVGSGPSASGGSKHGSRVHSGTCGSRPPQAGPGAGYCGSAAHGQPMPWELPGPEEGEKNGRKIPAGRGQVEGGLIRRTVAQEMMAYKGRGTLPAGWLRWAEEILAGNRPDWRRLLAAAIRRGLALSAGRMDYSFLRLNRRQAVYYPAILPGMVRPDLDVAVVIDTSGSMSEKELGLALGALRDLIRTVTGDSGRGIRALSCDAAVSAAQRVFSPRNVQLYGGGGTDMRVGIEAACKLRPKPGVIVVFTDGETPWPERPPEVPTVIALVGDAEVETPAWAPMVRISLERSA